MKKKHILFFTYGGGHINLTIPIIREILKTEMLEYTLIALNTAIAAVQDSGLYYKTLVDYLPYFENRSEIERVGNDLAKKYHNPDSGMSFDQSVAYLGLSMYDLIEQVGEAEAEKLFDANGRKIFLPVATADKIIEIEKPDCIVISVPYRMEAAAVIAGNKRCIKTVQIHDLCYVDANISCAQYHFVIGDIVRNELIRRKITSDRIFITGQPALDYLLKPPAKNKVSVCQELGLQVDKKIILFAAAPSSVILLGTKEELIKAISYYPDYQFLIKMHPGEEMVDYYREICERFNNATLVGKYDNPSLLYASDLLITEYSTMGMEASFIGRDVIVIDVNNLITLHRYDEFGWAVVADRAGSLISLISELSNNEDMQNKLRAARQYFWRNQVLASEQVVQSLEYLLRE